MKPAACCEEIASSYAVLVARMEAVPSYSSSLYNSTGIESTHTAEYSTHRFTEYSMYCTLLVSAPIILCVHHMGYYTMVQFTTVFYFCRHNAYTAAGILVLVLWCDIKQIRSPKRTDIVARVYTMILYFIL